MGYLKPAQTVEPIWIQERIVIAAGIITRESDRSMEFV